MLHSPLFASAAGLTAWWPAVATALPERAIPESANKALDVFQMKSVARQKLDVPTWHFVMNGADDGKTMAANRTAFDRWQIRVRRLVDVSRIDTEVEVFGEVLKSPIILAPVGAQQSLHQEGELATARAAAARNTLMICSTMTNYSIGEIAGAADGLQWFQLYPSRNRAFMKKLIDDAEAAGCRVLALTIDGPTLGNREAERWFRGQGGRTSTRLGNFENFSGATPIGDRSLTWDIVSWLRANTGMKIVLKGIVTREDAALAVKHRADGIIVSNHGGRQEESGRGTLESLPEVLEGADDQIPVLIDGGFRRGTDVFKALALGASAVCIGRPYLWGLGAFGQEGVDRVIRILQSELKRIMQFAGTTSVDSITADYLTRR
jgi:isopentenyl diphosphate isomerase/L-lactate dehydrogenase-like FMN-dependent dehydrogenase